MIRQRARVPLVIAGSVIVLALIPPVRHTLLHGFGLLAMGQLAQFQRYLQSLGRWAPVVSIALMVAGALAVPVPVTIIMVANGLVFGVWGGMLVSFAGGMIGGLAAYIVGHQFGRAIVRRLIPASSLAAADRMMVKYGGWAVVLERWIPGIPGDPISYAAGLTRMPVLAFVGLTAIGLLPANLVTAFVGEHVADDVPLRYWISGLVLIAILWIAWRVARRGRATGARTAAGEP